MISLNFCCRKGQIVPKLRSAADINASNGKMYCGENVKVSPFYTAFHGSLHWDPCTAVGDAPRKKMRSDVSRGSPEERVYKFWGRNSKTPLCTYLLLLHCVAFDGRRLSTSSLVSPFSGGIRGSTFPRKALGPPRNYERVRLLERKEIQSSKVAY